jgi:pheromone a factor receptor
MEIHPVLAEYIVQGHRFNIFEEIGCYPMTYNTPASFPLVYCWPVVIGLISAGYCCMYHIFIVLTRQIFNSLTAMTIYSVIKRRLDFGHLFPEGFNANHHFRLMALASSELLLGIPWSVYACLYLNIAIYHIEPYKSWDNVHARFSAVGQFPAFEWKQNSITVVSVELTRWATIVCAFIFFGLFGFAGEARKNYRIAINSIAKKVGYTTFASSGSISAPNRSMTMSGPGTMPIFISRAAVTKRDSFASLSTDFSIGDVGDTLDHDKEEPTS